MGDYPDYTNIIQIVGSDIMIPINVQAAYIMMPVDIQAQYVDLDINIKSQEVTINIDIDAQSVGVYLQPDWNVLQGTDKNITASKPLPDNTSVIILDYTVTAGKTFYVCQWGFSAFGNTGCWSALFYFHNEVSTDVALSGGMVGNSHSLSKPVAIAAGDRIVITNVQWSGEPLVGYAFIGGYEI